MNDQTKTDFDIQMDKIRQFLDYEIEDVRNHSTITENVKNSLMDELVSQKNKMEFARRVHNNYVMTGKVSIPE